MGDTEWIFYYYLLFLLRAVLQWEKYFSDWVSQVNECIIDKRESNPCSCLFEYVGLLLSADTISILILSTCGYLLRYLRCGHVYSSDGCFPWDGKGHTNTNLRKKITRSVCFLTLQFSVNITSLCLFCRLVLWEIMLVVFWITVILHCVSLNYRMDHSFNRDGIKTSLFQFSVSLWNRYQT